MSGTPTLQCPQCGARVIGLPELPDQGLPEQCPECGAALRVQLRPEIRAEFRSLWARCTPGERFALELLLAVARGTVRHIRLADSNTATEPGLAAQEV